MFMFVKCVFYFLVLFSLHRMREMQTIVTDVRGVCLSLSRSVCLSRGLNRRRRVQCTRGHSVQPLSNYYDHLFVFVSFSRLTFLVLVFVSTKITLRVERSGLPAAGVRLSAETISSSRGRREPVPYTDVGRSFAAESPPPTRSLY